MGGLTRRAWRARGREQKRFGASQMAATSEPDAPQPHEPAHRKIREQARLKSRAERWARLCSELTTDAAELKALREELIPDEHETRRRELWLEARYEDLERREVDLERRWHALKSRVSEFARRRKQMLAWQNEIEAGRRQKWDQYLARAAQLEQRADQQATDEAAWLDVLDTYEAELGNVLRELDNECRELDVECRELALELSE